MNKYVGHSKVQNIIGHSFKYRQGAGMDRFVTQSRKRQEVAPDEACHSKKSREESEEKLSEDYREEEEDSSLLEEFSHPIPWQKIEAEGLDCDYCQLFKTEEANELFNALEREIEYFTGDQTKVQVFGKTYSVPRKQATYGDEGLMYSFSGVHLLAQPWTPTLQNIRDAVTKATGHIFNFVLINRYKDGLDHMGEHRDDERELDPCCPIASVSLGAARDFVFRHRNSRGGAGKGGPPPVRLELAHGSLLLMNAPTNTHWYHSLPVRKKCQTPRINLTFRRILKQLVSTQLKAKKK